MENGDAADITWRKGAHTSHSAPLNTVHFYYYDVKIHLTNYILSGGGYSSLQTDKEPENRYFVVKLSMLRL